MIWRRLAAFLSIGAVLVGAGQAGDTIGLGNGAAIVIDEYLLETSPQGEVTVVVRTTPEFDPEPFGAVPSDDFARALEPLCAGLLRDSRDALREENAKYVRIRWDFQPSYDTGAPEGVTISRFHEFLYRISENWICVPMPLGVGLDNLSPDLPSGLPATLRYIEPGPRARQLSLTYVVAEPLAEVSPEKLENAAIELCILHADRVLEDRAKYYDQLQTALVSIAFEERYGDGSELERRVVFGARDNVCVTGLSPELSQAIRDGMAS